MQQYNIKLSKKFKKDITDIYNFISKDDSRYADIVINNIMSHCTGILSIMPHMGSIVDENKRIRKTIAQSFQYKITYTIEEQSYIIILLAVSKNHH